MKTLNRCIWLAALAFIALANTALGQGIENPTLTFNVITNGYTTTETIKIDTRKQENVALALIFSQSNATNVVPLTITLKKSVDGVNASDKDTISWSYIRAESASAQVATTNVSVAGYPYLILTGISAPGADANLVTVSSFKYFLKHMAGQ